MLGLHTGSGRPISWLVGACLIASRHCLLTDSLFCEEMESRFARFRIRVWNSTVDCPPLGGECGSGLSLSPSRSFWFGGIGL